MRSERTGAGLGDAHLGRLVAEWMRAAGLKLHVQDGVSPHALRHSFAHGLYGACADLRTVQDALGHTSISSTAIYMRHRSTLDRLRVAMDDAA